MTREEILSNLPFVTKMDSLFKLNTYLNTKQGSSIQKKWDSAVNFNRKMEKYKFLIGFVFIFIVPAAIYFLKISTPFQWIFIDVIVIMILLNYRLRKLKRLPKKEEEYNNAYWEWAIETAKKINETLNAYYYVLPNYHIFLFNEEFCMYVNTIDGDITGYSRRSIKRGSLELVYLSDILHEDRWDTYKYYAYTEITTHHKRKATVNREWWLDFYTGYLEQPYLKIEFPDIEEAEKYAKKAYALLVK